MCPLPTRVHPTFAKRGCAWLLACFGVIRRWVGGLVERGRAVPVGVGWHGVRICPGSFGAGGGVLMPAALAALRELALVRVNAVKTTIGGLANGVAALGFVAFGPVRWSAVAPL